VWLSRLQVTRCPSLVSWRSLLLVAALVGCGSARLASDESSANPCDESTTTLDNLGWLANAQWHTVSPNDIDRLWVIDSTEGAAPSDTCATPNGCVCLLSGKTPSAPSARETFCFVGSNEHERRLSRIFLYRVGRDLKTARACAAILMQTLVGPEVRSHEPAVGLGTEQEIRWRDRIGYSNAARLRISQGAESTFVLRLVWEKL
jgi:hypothetical protein